VIVLLLGVLGQQLLYGCFCNYLYELAHCGAVRLGISALSPFEEFLDVVFNDFAIAEHEERPVEALLVGHLSLRLPMTTR
jgi:hypothetical protein